MNTDDTDFVCGLALYVGGRRFPFLIFAREVEVTILRKLFEQMRLDNLAWVSLREMREAEVEGARGRPKGAYVVVGRWPVVFVIFMLCFPVISPQ